MESVNQKPIGAAHYISRHCDTEAKHELPRTDLEISQNPDQSVFLIKLAKTATTHTFQSGHSPEKVRTKTGKIQLISSKSIPVETIWKFPYHSFEQLLAHRRQTNQDLARERLDKTNYINNQQLKAINQSVGAVAERQYFNYHAGCLNTRASGRERMIGLPL